MNIENKCKISNIADYVIQPADTGAHLVKLHRFGCCARDVIDSCFRVIYNV